jgi:two-component system, chemotaxis family, chemotaxis protein CheY
VLKRHGLVKMIETGKTILTVDDSGSVRQQVSMVLKRAGFAILEAANGSEGVALISSRRDIDMVICDVNMPIMNGLEMVTKVKGEKQNEFLPILMLTTEGQPALVKRIKEAGAVGWIVKPFNPAQLLQSVERLTSAKPALAR